VRHDLHLLAQVHAKDPRCPAGRAHSRAALFPVGRGRARGGWAGGGDLPDRERHRLGGKRRVALGGATRPRRLRSCRGHLRSW